MDKLKDKTIDELLTLHVAIMEELRARGVVRTANNPTGDLAEYLFCAAFDWQQAPNSEKSFDASDATGTKFQIKGRRIHRRTTSRQLSAIRDLDGFDFLAAILFDDDYRVKQAALIPVAVVKQRAKPDRHTNSHKFMLQDNVWTEPDVKDVTEQLRAQLR